MGHYQGFVGDGFPAFPGLLVDDASALQADEALDFNGMWRR
jgi:hypothetical protein